ncbi:MAG: hypothetical protein KGJ55_01860 [Gammaproteobacteria bacterium]|nr:hypothetical protein [Gammaproteobacteria bacterium]
MQPAILVLLACVVAGCAARPMLYPNATVQRGGQAAADQAVNDCLTRADTANLSGPGASAAKGAAVGAGGGAAVGAAVGAVYGRAGRGAAAGAAGGGTGGFLGGLFRSGHNDPIYRAYVNRCLNDSGYDVIGWR